MESYRILSLLLLWSSVVMCNECPTSLTSDNKLMECMMNFSKYFMGGMGSLDPNNPDSVMELICSPEGKEAMKCVLDFVQKCPDVLKQPDGSNPLDGLRNMTGIDYGTFMTEGGMDGVCAMLIGPCSKVKECYDITPPGRKKRGYPMMSNVQHYQMFVLQAEQMCVSMKEQIGCMMEKLSACPESVVNKVEEEFEKALKMSMPDGHKSVSFKSTRIFVIEECPIFTSKIQSQTNCVNQFLTLNQDFGDCSENVTKLYEASSTCNVYKANSMCVSKHLNSTCGRDVDEFFIRNANVIYPGIPADCASKQVGAGNVVNLSFGILLLSLLISMFKCV